MSKPNDSRVVDPACDNNAGLECRRYPHQPDIDICRACGEHAEFTIDDAGTVESDCCGASPYDPGPDIDMER